MPNKKTTVEPVLVQKQAEIDLLVKTCHAEKAFAFDTEFVMEDCFEADLCLLQVATKNAVYLIDPFLDLDLAPMWELVANPEVQAVLHAGQEDLAVSVRASGKLPKNVFDIQIAAGLAGYDYPMSLQRLVQAVRHVRLHKAKTLTDWRKRPLSAEQIQYAAEDVSHLLSISDHLEGRLRKLNRLEWSREEFGRFEIEATYKKQDVDKILRIKGAGSLKGQQLAILKKLFAWRDELAQRLNRPARVVVKDYLLVEIAKHNMAEYEEICDLRGINIASKDIRSLCEVVRDALTIPKSEWPIPKKIKPEVSGQAALVALATAVIRSYCGRHDLAYAAVASQKSITELVRYCTKNNAKPNEEVNLLTGWRGETVGKVVAAVLQGKRHVSVERINSEFGICVSPADDERGTA